jgi:hypothetical protein
MMASSRWDLSQYWDFIYQQNRKRDSVIRHDVSCIENIRAKVASMPGDELGPVVMFVTLDSKLLRLRKRYPFILSAEQFVEFMLPYLFMSDIPVKEAEAFPNQLLSAHLGTLLVRRPPKLAEQVSAFLRDPSLPVTSPQELGSRGSTIAQALSGDRFKAIVDSSQKLPDSDKAVVAVEVARLLEQIATEERDRYFRSRNIEAELERLREEVSRNDQHIEKLQRTVRYWKHQRPRN